MTKRHSVLIVEDRPDLARMTMLVLKQSRFEADVAHTGQQAMEYIKTRRPDVMLLDIDLPDMLGWDVLSYLNEEYPSGGTRIIVVTGRRVDAAELMEKMPEVHQYLMKPVRPNSLVDVIRRELTYINANSA
ncbi:MAG: response regulator [Aggregatilineales bacterium]